MTRNGTTALSIKTSAPRPNVNSPLKSIEHFFFRRESALGMGLMRASWGCTILWVGLARSVDVLAYYSNNGLVPMDLAHIFLRNERFSAFDYMHTDQAVIMLYIVFLISAFTTMIGLFPRLSTIISCVLVLSLQERNYFPLAGGDTVLRVLGVLLMVSPGIGAFSVSRLWKQWKHFRTSRTLLSPMTMPAWPRLLLLWQLIVLYVTSDWSKLMGSAWIGGYAPSFALHHPDFSRFGGAIYDAIPYSYAFIAYFTMLWEAMWIFFLIPPSLTKDLPFGSRGRFRRWMIFSGVMFHLGIQITMYVGNFSWAMWTAYFGILMKEDFEVFRKFFNKKMKNTFVMLYDGGCKICIRTAFIFTSMDWLHRITLADIRTPEGKAKAPSVSIQELDRVMHVKLPSAKFMKGFVAVRSLSKNLPPLWPITPFLYLPGVRPIGERVYAWISARRSRCTHENCTF